MQRVHGTAALLVLALGSACAPSRGLSDFGSGSNTTPNSDGGPARDGGSVTDGGSPTDAGMPMDGGSDCGDTTSDPMNCSACGVVCPTSSTGTAMCVNSTCALQCESDSATTACVSPSTCSMGHCCGDTQSWCGSSCIDTQTDPNNCGTCGKVCQSTSTTQGECSGGECTSTCANGAVMCSGVCTDTKTSNSDCGRCGNACASDMFCSSSSCECDSPLALCSGECVEEDSDAANCGACGRACGGGQQCLGGTCTTTVTCTVIADSPWQSCDGLMVTAGASLSMRASGTFTSTGVGGTYSNGPGGDSPCPWFLPELTDSGANCGAPLWGIEALPGAAVSASGSFSSSGSVSATVPESGTIEFQINDAVYTDDSGSMTLTITTQ